MLWKETAQIKEEDEKEEHLVKNKESHGKHPEREEGKHPEREEGTHPEKEEGTHWWHHDYYYNHSYFWRW